MSLQAQVDGLKMICALERVLCQPGRPVCSIQGHVALVKSTKSLPVIKLIVLHADSMRKPTNTQLYERVKREAKRKFRSWPSARASQWLVAEYQRRGGGYSGRSDNGLNRWKREEWLNLCCPQLPRCGGRKGTQVCRPSKRISSKTPTPLAQDISPADRRRFCAMKRRYPRKRLSFK